uniref:Uncharacterized protein n=1 Tax=Sphingobacterium sp. (strain 21) TaxID=743722 RepID=F4C2N6_SPHS2
MAYCAYYPRFENETLYEIKTRYDFTTEKLIFFGLYRKALIQKSALNYMLKCIRTLLNLIFIVIYPFLNNINKLKLLIYKEIMGAVIDENKVVRCYDIFNIL